MSMLQRVEMRLLKSLVDVGGYQIVNIVNNDNEQPATSTFAHDDEQAGRELILGDIPGE
jgi:hypothetical protein